MAKNVVQFQKGLSEAAFRSQYGTDEQCRAALFSWQANLSPASEFSWK
jgi:hypothetical protein